MKDAAQLIHGYLEGDLGPDHASELGAWVEQSDTNAEQFVRSCVQHYLLREQAVGVDLAGSAFSAEDALPSDTEGRTSPDLLADLASIEGQAQFPSFHTDAPHPLTRKVYASALSYVIRHTFTPKRVVALATAAALLFGAVLAIVLLSGPDEIEPIAEAPGEPAPVAGVPGAQRIVATLSAEHEAVWDRRPGEDLYAGQRFTLTQGFAEITTIGRAVVVLEAPATIELIDSPNALRLHTGKLVGICETESSKGLLVRTPLMDVVDVGTRFAVEAEIDQTFVGVIDGEASAVAVDPREGTIDPGTRVLLTADQGAVVTREVPSLVRRTEVDTTPFARSMDDALYLPKWTGQLRFLHEVPVGTGLAMLKSNEQLFMIPEQRGVVLDAGTDVGISKPGRLFSGELVGPSSLLAAPQRVDSYLVQLNCDAAPKANDREGTRLTATLRFPRPIVGVLVTKKQLRETDRRVGLSGLDYEIGLGRELVEDSGGFSSDVVEISEDGKTLTMSAYALWLDHVRVLVQSPSAVGDEPTSPSP
ncbi:MAG: FecR family protein [Phycisphaeraceae bacterium]|nr:FecR family protein [Phycisphaeraceae bacterium]